MVGHLYIVATPIGNLGDITKRAIEILQQVDFIAAEDTRRSKILLEHFAISSEIIAYHEHNENKLTPKLIKYLDSGKSIALISDAGTPLINDPGYKLVISAHDKDIKVIQLFGKIGSDIGLLFQIADDFIDYKGSTKKAGKKTKKDQKKGKATLISLLGYENAIKYSNKIKFDILKRLKVYEKKTGNINQTIDYILNRNK